MVNEIKEAQRVLKMEAEAILALSTQLDDSFCQAIDLLEKTIRSGGKIILLGVGKSGLIGEKIAATLTSTGAPTVVLNPLNALHGDLGVVTDGDLLLLLSYSGETEELLNILPFLARFKASRIAITGNATSTLAKSVNLTLNVAVQKEACPHNLAPTTSTTVMLALGDALAMVLLKRRGFTRENFAQFHPGGILGRSLLLRVTDIMRPLQEATLVTPEQTVTTVLEQMTQQRSGAAIVISTSNHLLGIFTHGDFVRHFSHNNQIANALIGDLMTLSPITIDAEKLAAEALLMLEQHRIDDLIVVDHQGIPLGIIDSQDLTRLKLL